MVRRSALALLLALVAGCEDVPAPRSSYYDEHIAPTFAVGCVQQTTGCHVATDQGTAPGNLDLSSFDALMRRADVLPAYGPYPVGLILMKAGPPVTVQVETIDPPDPERPDERFVRVETDVRHAGGPGIALDSRAFAELKQWIAIGHTRTGVPANDPSEPVGSCRSGAGTAPGFDPSEDPEDSDSYGRFVRDVQPILRERCANASCHGSPIADLYLPCGDTDEEKRWSYFIAVEHLASPASTSELLRRPLLATRGGTYHEGGDVFLSTDDEDYVAIREWGEAHVEAHPGDVIPVPADEGFRFFANRVQPVLVRKGCMFLNCHSPAMFHDLRLRGGSQGTFSRVATERNYEMARLQLALESADPNDSRIVAKNLYPPASVDGGEGLAHRGGSLFEDFGVEGRDLNRATLSDCDGVDAERGDLNEVPAYCVIAEWLEIERGLAIDRGELEEEPLFGVAFVSRPTGVGDARDFDTFRGGADLRVAPITLGDDGVSLGDAESALSGCGLSGDVDVRGPAPSWDGQRVAFAARTSANEPLRLYWMNRDGSACERVPDIESNEDEENGVLTHDFDPAFAPDGRLVFASTRGNLDRDRHSYAGPTRTPAAMQPNANLYVLEDGQVRQLTFLLNQEVGPSFMRDGRLVFTAEKREPDFHQLAGRRMNLDGADYHPLFAQRDSVGFASATDIAELPNRNLVLVAGPLDATDGAGTIAIVNRSIGPDQRDRSPEDRFYLHSMSFPVGSALEGATGAFRSPSPLPTGRALVSCALDATDLSSGPFAFALCELDTSSGGLRELFAEPGRAIVDAVAIYARPNEGVFQSRIDEANGNVRIEDGERDANVHFLDVPLLGTLLFRNTRTGRPIDPHVGGLDVLEALPPDVSATTFDDLPSSDIAEDAFGRVYVRRERLGGAPLEADGSLRVRVPGGTPIVLRLTDGDGDPLVFGPEGPFAGEMVQREQMQFYPGEHANQGVPRRFFNGLCGGCHGSISGRELDIAVDVDILTSASRTLARDLPPVPMAP